jgi:arylsulfatase A-like enzyme
MVPMLITAMVAANPPHLIFMLGDEVGYNNVQWHSKITLTPRMTEQASTGLTLERHYVQRWCAASRTALLTGRYPSNTGLNEYNHGTEEERSAVPVSFQMLPKLLKQAPTPYATHMLGKWHLGFFTQSHTPHGRGFDSFFGFFCGASTHDTRGSQISHTCKLEVTDLYNTTHIANTTGPHGGWATNHYYNTHMYQRDANSQSPGPARPAC